MIKSTPYRLNGAIQSRASQDTIDYFELKNKPQQFYSKRANREEAMKQAGLDGFVAEYGVYKGESLRQICRYFAGNKVFAFDSFKGLPHNGFWGGNYGHRNKFKFKDIPWQLKHFKPNNAKLIIGRFEATTKTFDYDELNCGCKFVHLDCDVYESTVIALEHLQPYIQKGTIIVFDDYCDYWGWREGQFKAWQEFRETNSIRYSYIGIAGMAVSIKIL